MKKRFFLRYWPVTMVMMTMLLSHLLLLSFVTVKAFTLTTRNEPHNKPLVSPTPPDASLIPNTGDSANSTFAGVFSSWFLWGCLGMALLFFLFLKLGKTRGKAHHVKRKERPVARKAQKKEAKH